MSRKQVLQGAGAVFGVWLAIAAIPGRPTANNNEGVVRLEAVPISELGERTSGWISVDWTLAAPGISVPQRQAFSMPIPSAGGRQSAGRVAVPSSSAGWYQSAAAAAANAESGPDLEDVSAGAFGTDQAWSQGWLERDIDRVDMPSSDARLPQRFDFPAAGGTWDLNGGLPGENVLNGGLDWLPAEATPDTGSGAFDSGFDTDSGW